jgi:hypothetical protein
VLLALVIISITAVAVMTSFSTAIGASAEESHLAQINTILKSYAEVATAEIQENSPQLYTSCASVSTYKSGLTSMPSVPSGYSVTLNSVTYWNGSTFSSSCTSGSTGAQLLTITATGPGNARGTLSFAVSDFAYVQPPLIAPSFTLAGPVTYTVGVGTAWTYTVTTSAGSPTPAITVSSLPSGVSFVDNGNGTGTLTGVSTVASGSYTIVFTASNSVGTADTLSFDLVVATAPVFTSASTVSFASGSHVSYTISASDTDSQPPALALDSTLSGSVKNLTFNDNGNGTGTLSGTLTSGTTGTYNLVFEADNSVGIATTQTLTITIPTTPVFTSASSLSWKAGSTVSFTVSATDTDSIPPSLALTSTLAGAVKNLSFKDNGNGTGTLSGTLVSGTTGSYAVTFQAKNSASQATNQTLTVTVPTTPVFTSATTVSWKAGAAVSFTVAASDTDSTSPALALTSSLTGAVKNLTFVDNGNGTGTLSGTLVSATTGTYSLSFQATNSAGQSTAQTLTVTVPTVPVFTSATSVTWSKGTSVNFTVSATDTDSQYPSFTLNTALSGALKNLTFVDNGNGTASLKGTLYSTTTGTYPLSITATNSAGQTTSQTLTVTVH